MDFPRSSFLAQSFDSSGVLKWAQPKNQGGFHWKWAASPRVWQRKPVGSGRHRASLWTDVALGKSLCCMFWGLKTLCWTLAEQEAHLLSWVKRKHMEEEGNVSICFICAEDNLSSGIKITIAICDFFFKQPLVLQILPLKDPISILFSLIYFYVRRKESEEIHKNHETFWTSVASM